MTPEPTMEFSKFPLKRRRFLERYAESGSIGLASAHAGVSRRTHLNWKKSDGKFAEAFGDAQESAVDGLEQEAMRRAKDGVSQPVYHQGKEVGTIQKYSDILLIFMLRALKPEKYRDNFGQSSETWTELDTRMSDAKASLAKKLERLCAQHPVSQGTPDPARLPSQGAQP